MKRPIYFCDGWFRAKKIAPNIWTEEQAKKAHENKQLFTVLIDSVERPTCFLDITNKFVGVSFLDNLLREYLSYEFQEVEPGKLFLSMAIYRKFVGETDKVDNGTVYIFKQDGTAIVEREYFNPHHKESMRTFVDVSSNYADMPSFGEYDQLIVKERG